MKRRLLAFLLAFVMTFSLVPVNAFAAEADAAALYTNITTESGENVTVEYVETVVGEAAWGQSINTPYYHVTIPEGTGKVLLTYPESVKLVLSGDDGAVFFYRNTYPGQSTIDLGGALTVATNNDGSKTVAIPVENFMLSTDGSVAVGMAYYVDGENQSAAEFFDFTYAALTHAVTLTSGEGYTLTGEATAEDGKDYTFTVTVSEGYDAANMVVKVNGEEVTAVDGIYTVEKVSSDLTITVEGVTEAVQKTAGLSVLKFGDTSTEAKAQMFQLIPAFDPAVKEYTVLVPDNSNMFYAWATQAVDRSSSTTITAKWVNLNVDTEKTQALTSGKASGQNLAGFAPTGTKVNTMTVTVVDGDFKDEYKLTSVRVAPSLTALSLDGIRFAERFSATKTAYTATTAAESVTVAATPRDESYTVTVNGGSDTTVPLNLGENKINVVVTNSGGYTNTYTITVTRLASIEVGFTVDPADAKVTVWDSNKDRIAPTDGKYSVMADAEYTYLVQSDGYVSQKSSFKFSESSTIDITLAVATENPNLDRSITAEWGNFRNGDNNLGITNAKTPYAPEDTELLWAVKHGTGWAAAPGSPIMVDGDIYTYSGSTIRRLNSMTGEVVTEGTMVDKSSYSIVPMTYGDGMVFVGLSGGKIQAFNAKTLESLWVYTDELGGQPNCPITYKDGYIYAGFWNSEDRNANFACINTVDEDHASTTEAKYASWTYTRQGGFYWAVSYTHLTLPTNSRV